MEYKVPIEIILQDAEAPVNPTPTPEEETNITVPDTGTISNGSNNEGVSVSASIIFPAIIVILAIVTIVALLVHKQHKHFSFKMNKKEKLATVASSTVAILAAMVLVGNLVIPATNAATDDVNNNESTYLETKDKITITAIIDKDSEEDTIIVDTKDVLYATTDASGYTVTMSMIQGAINSNLYLNGDEASEYYIAPVEVNENSAEEGTRGTVEELEGTELTNNTWGYTLNEEAEEYSPVPTADTPATIKEGGEAVTHEEIDVYYTVKVNKELPLGTYTGTIEYNIEGNYGFPDTLTTMQGMTHEICESVPTPGNKVTDPVPTATLEDTRDHKTYTIAKLADGNCWMTQNLDLDLNENITFTPADTDVSESWTPMRSTIYYPDPKQYGQISGWTRSDSSPYSIDLDNIYYYTSGDDNSDIKYSALTECEAVHNDGTCQHYHVGNLYNWSAAVASNDTSEMTTQYENAPDSICPAGWRLPVGPEITNPEYGEMANMLQRYNLLEENLTEDCEGTCNYYKYMAGGFIAIRSNPIWLALPGYYTDYYDSPGGRGVYHSGTVGVGSVYGRRAQPLVVTKNGVNSIGRTYSRSSGYSIRCVAQ